jgi:hypothetical protein
MRNHQLSTFTFYLRRKFCRDKNCEIFLACRGSLWVRWWRLSDRGIQVEVSVVASGQYKIDTRQTKLMNETYSTRWQLTLTNSPHLNPTSSLQTPLSLANFSRKLSCHSNFLFVTKRLIVFLFVFIVTKREKNFEESFQRALFSVVFIPPFIQFPSSIRNLIRKSMRTSLSRREKIKNINT